MVATTLSPQGKSIIGNQIRLKHKATTGEYADARERDARQSLSNEGRGAEISVVG
jgi:hypothetical protein